MGMFGGHPVELPEALPAFQYETLTSQSRGTLTLTRDGPVLGCPEGCPLDAQNDARQRVGQWQSGGGVLVLPWPVDVTDIR